MTQASTPSRPQWTVSAHHFDAADVERNGNKFLIGNGYLGLRGTLEEHGAADLAACTISGLYDKNGDLWREPVNAPAAFGVRVRVNGQPCDTKTSAVKGHRQWVELDAAVHHRESVLGLDNGHQIKLSSSRFLSVEDKHLGVLKFTVEVDNDCHLSIETGIDGAIWDINGPHLKCYASDWNEGVLSLKVKTVELDTPVLVATSIESDSLPQPEFRKTEKAATLAYTIDAKAGGVYSFFKYILIHTGADTDTPFDAAPQTLANARNQGFEKLLRTHRKLWTQRWCNSDVQIDGDDEAQLALRYSIYHLLIAASTSDRASIPARGLSGQVYKGAIFWDTEIFMLPFFDHTQPDLARHLVSYRYHTLDGARRKAAEYGYRGAYYAWESQESGDDACTLFNITDVLTNRPMRTYFRDKQVHISGDVALATWRHYTQSGDVSVLLEGGAEVILECARFYYSYAWYKPERDRFEVLDVVGPDEYHERVDNNAFTSAMVHATLRIALKTIELLEREHTDFCYELISKLDYSADREHIANMLEKLYVPEPDPKTGLIEQFSGYFQLEDNTPAGIKDRLLDPTEYWGGSNGIATNTQVLKQADVVLMLHLFSSDYSTRTKTLNWDYYEPRTEHGSSLSPCVYALVAAELGRTEWAYKYFLRTATIDLTGKSKQFVGPLYIGGTHPAANGGAWMAAVLGFGGLRANTQDARISLKPQLPKSWTGLTYRFSRHGQWFTVKVTNTSVSVSADSTNTASQAFDIYGQPYDCAAGQTLEATANAAIEN